MLLMAIDKGLPIDEVVFFNIGVENILFAVNCKTTRKNKFEIKVFILGN